MLEDVMAPGLDVVFCGTAAGTRSAAVMHYYAGRNNKFWPTLFRVGLTPRQLDPSDDREVLSYGIGLTDVAKHQAGSDRDIQFDARGAATVRALILQAEPRFLCFNGKRAAREFFGRGEIEYGLQDELVGPTAVYVLPSTAGLASGFWDEARWQEMADAVRAGPG